MFGIPFVTRLGIAHLWGGWNITCGAITNSGIWSYESVAATHIVFSGLCFLADIWHWVYWDPRLADFSLVCFRSRSSAFYLFYFLGL